LTAVIDVACDEMSPVHVADTTSLPVIVVELRFKPIRIVSNNRVEAK
jgi:hypothetical protein